MNGDPTLERIAKGNGLALCASGPWIARFASELEQIVSDAERLKGRSPNIFIDVSQVSKLDTFGAWLIERLRRSLTQGGVEAKIAGLSTDYSSLVDEVRRVKAIPAADVTSVTITGILDSGRPHHGRDRRHHPQPRRHAGGGAGRKRTGLDPPAGRSA